MFRLLVLSALMLISTIFAAFTPLYLSLSSKTSSKIELIGKGILIGAGLGIIIPEGVGAVYGSIDHDAGEHSHDMSAFIGLALLAGFMMMFLIDSFHPHSHAHSTAPQYRRHSRRASVYLNNRLSAELSPLATSPPIDHIDKLKAYDWEDDSESRIGLKNKVSSSPILMSRVSSSSLAATMVEMKNSGSISTVLGLLLHSLADGIALGASSISSSSSSPVATKSLDLIIFLAIMLHKAPTAFALSTLLLSSPSNSKSFIKKSLLAFCFAAPIGALMTFGLLNLLGEESGTGDGQGGDLSWWTGIILVFSGGSFLFVATGVMNNGSNTTSGSRSEEASLKDSFGEEEEVEIGAGFKVILTIVGMVTPIILSRVVGHGH